MFAKPRVTLYGGTGCGSAAVEVMLTLAEVPYDFIIATLWEPTPALADLQRVNPLVQVPTLVLANGDVLTESAAMMLWLADSVPSMNASDSDARAALYRWTVFVPANIYAMFAIRDFPERWVDDAASQVLLKERATEHMKFCYKLMEQALKPAPYLLGATMSALDIYLAMTTQWTPGRNWFNEHCPNIMRAVALTETHPAVARVWERNFKR